eukprot:1181188-Prorocentrum_minimum.AAC.2
MSSPEKANGVEVRWSFVTRITRVMSVSLIARKLFRTQQIVITSRLDAVQQQTYEETRANWQTDDPCCKRQVLVATIGRTGYLTGSGGEEYIPLLQILSTPSD